MREIDKIQAIIPYGSSSETIIRSDNVTGYDAGDVIGNAATSILTFDDVLPIKGIPFKIECVWMTIKLETSLPGGIDAFTLHLYNASPANITDGTAWSVAVADISKYLGSISIAKPIDAGDFLFTQQAVTGFQRELASASNSLYGFLATGGAYTPTAKAEFTIHLETKLI